MQQQLNEPYSSADYAFLSFHEKELQISPSVSDGFHLRLERIVNTYRFINDYDGMVKISNLFEAIKPYEAKAQKYRKDIDTFTNWKSRLLAVMSALDTGVTEQEFRLSRLFDKTRSDLYSIGLILKSMDGYHMADAVEHRIVLIEELIDNLEEYLCEDENREREDNLRLLQSDDDDI